MSMDNPKIYSRSFKFYLKNIVDFRDILLAYLFYSLSCCKLDKWLQHFYNGFFNDVTGYGGFSRLTKSYLIPGEQRLAVGVVHPPDSEPRLQQRGVH